MGDETTVLGFPVKWAIQELVGAAGRIGTDQHRFGPCAYLGQNLFGGPDVIGGGVGSSGYWAAASSPPAYQDAAGSVINERHKG